MKHLPQITASAPGPDNSIRELSASAENGIAVIHIRGRISGIESELFEMQINELLNQGIRDAILKINSPGGNLIEANQIVNIIKEFPGSLTTEVGAICASAATFPAMQGNISKIASNGLFMIHRPWINSEGNEDQLEGDLNLLRKLQEEMIKEYAAKTGFSMEELREKWQKDWWMNADEAVQNGFVDEKMTDEAEMEPEDFREVFSMGYSNIPDQIAAQAFKPKQHSSQNNSDMDRNQLIKALGLQATATDQQIIDAVKDNAEKAQRVQEVENQLQQEQESKAQALVDEAISAGKIQEDQKEHFLKLAKADFESTKQVLNSKEVQKGPTLRQVPNAGAGQGTKEVDAQGNKKDWDWYQKNDPENLAKLEKDDPEAFKELYKGKYGVEPDLS